MPMTRTSLGNPDEMFLILGPAQSAGQFQIVGNLVVNLSEPRIGIERVRIVATEIIVSPTH